jgi:DNA-binding CsgD family transcriptional regulator
VGRIASTTGGIEVRAAAMLDTLRRVVPFQAGCISLHDVRRRRFDSLVSEGYGPSLHEFFDGPIASTHLQLLALHELRRALPARDLPRPQSEIRIWADHLLPAGFLEGISVGLFTPDGRHVGMLSLNTDSAAHPTDAACALIDQLVPIIAHAIDPMRSIALVAGMVVDAHAGAVLTRAGALLPLPGLPSHPLLNPALPVLAVATERLANASAYASFLCPYPGQGAYDYVRITALACPVQPNSDLSAMVLISAPGEMAGLTPRELQVLGLIVDGWPNQRIATWLVVANRTIAAHVEHILVKLGARTRTAAAALALSRGIYVPRALGALGTRDHAWRAEEMDRLAI